jgi:hypothetical protein
MCPDAYALIFVLSARTWPLVSDNIHAHCCTCVSNQSSSKWNEDVRNRLETIAWHMYVHTYKQVHDTRMCICVHAYTERESIRNTYVLCFVAGHNDDAVCMCVCICMYVYMYIYTYIHTYAVFMYMYVHNIYVCIYISVDNTERVYWIVLMCALLWRRSKW